MARPIPITYATIVIAIGACAGLYVFAQKLSPRPTIDTNAAKKPAPPPPPMVEPAASGPIAFRDRDNLPAWKRLREHVDELKTALESLPTAKAPPSEDLEPICTKVKDDLVPLAGETNPEVSRTVNAARRGCDLDRHVQLAELGLRLLQSDATPAAKKARCIWIGAQTKTLIDQHFGDEPEAKLVIGKVGSACVF
jgi:hypothetical protein